MGGGGGQGWGRGEGEREDKETEINVKKRAFMRVVLCVLVHFLPGYNARAFELSATHR